MRKRGNRIKHRAVVMPLGVKQSKYELNARAALLALARGVHNQQHLADLYVLAEICGEIADEPHIKAHVLTVQRLIDGIYSSGKATEADKIAMEASIGVLLDYFKAAPNAAVARVTTEWIGRMAA